MYDLFIKNFDKISLFVKEPVFWILVVVSFLLGMKFFHTLHQGELAELNLKAERLEVLEKKYATESENLTPEQINLLKAIYRYQEKTVSNKVIIASNSGFIFDEMIGRLSTINLVREVLKQEPTAASVTTLSNFILSMPKKYMLLIPEIRWDSPFVVRVTQRGVEKIQ